MQVFKGVKELPGPISGSVVTIGNFDGVHLGHQQLIEAVVRQARRLKIPGIVYTFHPHPVKVLHPERATVRLFDLRDQQEQFAQQGIDAVIIEEFTTAFSQISATEFLRDYIMKKLNPQVLVVGHDFSFGADREGNIPFLENFCATHKIQLIIIPPFEYDGAPVSSSRIRQSLKDGNMTEVRKLLGRPYYLRGIVEHGHRRGHAIGVPTANVHPDVDFIPRLGVYCSQTQVAENTYPSVTNIGVNPTFTAGQIGAPIKVETHILDFNGDLYGKEVEIYLYQFLRDEKKFSSIEDLKNQIASDILDARGYFDENH